MVRHVLLLWVLSCSLPAAATTVYQCTAADGRTTYQDSPCPDTQRQQRLPLPGVPGAADRPMKPAATEAPAEERTAEVSPPPSPTAPLPLLYGCTRATDGQTYLSPNGNPAPYQAPFGMLGAVQLPLSDVYGASRGDAGISAPEANRGRVSADLVANNYVWVQDRCRELTAEETCHALRDAYEENARKLRRAFKSDRPPLERRDSELQAQLDNC